VKIGFVIMDLASDTGKISDSILILFLETSKLSRFKEAQSTVMCHS
jgi:hypothetical protein